MSKTFKAEVKSIIFPKGVSVAESFCIVNAKIDKGRMRKVVINANVNPLIKIGTKFEFIGHEESNQYGTQLVVDSLLFGDINDENVLHSILANVTSEQLATEILQLENAQQVLEDGDIETLTSIHGIGKVRAAQIVANYRKFKEGSGNAQKLVKLMEELSRLGCNSEMLTKLANGTNDLAIEKVKETRDVFFLMYESQCSFADICKGFAVDGNDVRTIAAHLYNEMYNWMYQNGKTYLPFETPFANNEAKEYLIGHDLLVSIPNVGHSLKEIWTIKKQIIDFVTINYNKDLEFDEELALEVIENAPFKLNDKQRQAVWEGVKAKLFVLCGNAGTGKTTTLRVMSDYFRKQHKHIVQVALSGKAAQRMSEATGLPAYTIHRALYQEKFVYADVLIIDECSMVGAELFAMVLKAVEDGVQVIIVGDDAQLPPIGFGNVFVDLLQSKVRKIKLDQVMRQQGESGILDIATKVRNSERVTNTNYDDFKLNEGDVINTWLNNRDSQIIAPSNKTCQRINNQIQNILFNGCTPVYQNKYTNLFIGDKVINIKNNYNITTMEGLQVAIFNGNIGELISCEEESYIVKFGEHECLISKDHIDNIVPAYAITVHKAQGSEADTILCYYEVDHWAHTVNSLYTAVTRARVKCYVWISDINIVLGKYENDRDTILKKLL
jgi:RecD/TraA family predicted helicase